MKFGELDTGEVIGRLKHVHDVYSYTDDEWTRDAIAEVAGDAFTLLKILIPRVMLQDGEIAELREEITRLMVEISALELTA